MKPQHTHQRLVSAKATAPPDNGTSSSDDAAAAAAAAAPPVAATGPVVSAATALVQALRTKAPPALLWARLTGFPHWPARFCSPHEEATLRLKKAPSSTLQVRDIQCPGGGTWPLLTLRALINRHLQVAVAFFGTACMRGWVSERDVAEFTPDRCRGCLF